MASDISIIIPVYNRVGIVGRTLDAVAAQTWRPLTVILVDNNSTDGSRQVLRKWKAAVEADDFKVIVAEELEPGAGAARNAGLSIATTQWTMFFDSDDIMLPTHVENAMKFAMSHPDAELIGWDRAINHIDGRRVLRRFGGRNHDFHNVFHSSMATHSYMAKTELFRRAGGWNEVISMGDDIEIGQRLLRLNPRIYHTRMPITVEVMESAESITSATVHRISEFQSAYESIRANLPERRRHWIDLRYIVLATNEARVDPESPAFVKKILKHTPLPRRWLWNLFYLYSSRGGRGVAALYTLIGRI